MDPIIDLDLYPLARLGLELVIRSDHIDPALDVLQSQTRIFPDLFRIEPPAVILVTE